MCLTRPQMWRNYIIVPMDPIMPTTEEVPAKSILKMHRQHSTNSSTISFHTKTKRASFSDDPVLIQFSQQFFRDSELEEPPSGGSKDLQRRKSFEEKRKELYDGMNIKSLLAKKPKELVTLELEDAGDLLEEEESQLGSNGLLNNRLPDDPLNAPTRSH